RFVTRPTQTTTASDASDEASALQVARSPNLHDPSNLVTKSIGDTTAESLSGADSREVRIARNERTFIPRSDGDNVKLSGIDESDRIAQAGAQPGSIIPEGAADFLNEARLGRWILDYLAKEASRPNAGTTGFDPRITPTYPG